MRMSFACAANLIPTSNQTQQWLEASGPCKKVWRLPTKTKTDTNLLLEAVTNKRNESMTLSRSNQTQSNCARASPKHAVLPSKYGLRLSHYYSSAYA